MKAIDNCKTDVSTYRKATPFFVVFTLVFLQELLSYPFQHIFPSNLFDYIIEKISAEKGFIFLVYMMTCLSFFILISTYYILPTRKNIKRFQDRDIVPVKSIDYALAWCATTFLILLSSAAMFYQAGQVMPLLQAASMESAEYSVYRSVIGAMVNQSLSRFTLHFLVPVSLFLSFVCVKRKKVVYRTLSIILMMIAAMFSLDRSHVPVAFLVLLLIYLVYKPINTIKLVLPAILVIGLTFLAMVYSTKEAPEIVLEQLLDRVIHGQWLGMPLYFYLFKDQSINIASLLHPSIQYLLGISDLITPGREIMMYIEPDAAIEGSAGNVPTYFVGEAYVIGGWTGVIVSSLHVSVELWLFTHLFNRMRKTFLTCCIYGWILYKIWSGLTAGYSAFLFSSLQAVLLILLFGYFCYEAVRNRKLSLDCAELSAKM